MKRQGQEQEICYKNRPISKISHFSLEEFWQVKQFNRRQNFHKYRRLKQKKPSRTRSQETSYLYQLLIIIEMRGRTNPLYQLAIKSINLSKEYTKTQALVSQCQKHDIFSSLQKIRFEALGMRPPLSATGIGIRNILIHGPLRITIYYLPQGKIMKLHDHPQMEVVNYVIKGNMQASIYSHLKENIYKKERQVLQANSIKYIDGMNTKQDNLHEFKALQPTFFLDIIFPDYDEQRPCKFYQQQQPALNPNPNEVTLKEISYIQDDFFQI